MNKCFKYLGAALAFAAICGAAQAASSGIRSSKKNECALWLCVPGGFPGVCAAAHAAMVGRITDLGRHGRRKYTTIPAFSNCREEAQQQPEYLAVKQQAEAAGGQFAKAWHNTNVNQGSAMTYDETNRAYIPAHKECLLVRTRGDTSDEYCAGWKQVPERYVDGARCQWNFGNGADGAGSGGYEPYEFSRTGRFIIGSLNSPAYCTDTIHRLTVRADGGQYGNPYDYVEKEPAYSGPRPW